MGERLRTVRRAATTIWALITAMLLLLSLAIALVSLSLALRASHNQLNDLRVESQCRTAAAAQLESANISRDDALADLQETIARLFDASFRRDTAAIATEAAKLPVLSDRIHAATDAIHAANEQRLASVEHCQ